MNVRRFNHTGRSEFPNFAPPSAIGRVDQFILYSMQLYNKIDKRILEQQLQDSNVERITLSFYKYHQISNPEDFRNEFFAALNKVGVFGRIYVAYEGVNGQISVPREQYEAFEQVINSIDFLAGIRLNIAIEDDGKSFIKLIIKVRDKIVADGLDDSSFDVTNCGKHVSAQEFNELADDPETVIVDMRNHYESEVGHFKNAITPDADTFRDELPMVEEILEGKEDKNILMYCTGGIRCEKASAWFKHLGFENVHQLEGGIIKYKRDVEAEGLENKFLGKNFVFDKRMAEKISDDVLAACHQCGEPADTHVNCVNEACHLLFIQCAACAEKYSNCCSDECKEFKALPEETRRELRKGLKVDQNIYRKGRPNHALRKELRLRLDSLKT